MHGTATNTDQQTAPVGEHGVGFAELRVYQPHDVLQILLPSILHSAKNLIVLVC